MTINPDLYPTQFHHYLTRNLSYVLRLVQAAGPVLDEELREQALHTLRYALQAPTVWPLTRTLFLTLAPKMEQGGQREHWMPYLQEALRQSEAQGDGVTAGECHFQLALLYRLMSHFAAAHEHLQAALAHFRALDARRDQARILNELAWLEHLQHQYDAANQHVEQAIMLLDVDDIELAMSYRVQGAIANGSHQWSKAEQYHRLALLLFENHGDRRKVAWSLQNLAYTYHRQTKYEEAFILYEQAAAMLEQLGDIYHFAMVSYNLGYNHFVCDQSNKAVHYYKCAETIFKKLHDVRLLAKLYTDLGLAYFNLQDYINAEYSFNQSAKGFAGLHDESWRLNAIDGLAMTYLAQENYSAARMVLAEAMEALSQAGQILNYDYLHRALTGRWLQTIEAQEAILSNACTSIVGNYSAPSRSVTGDGTPVTDRLGAG